MEKEPEMILAKIESVFPNPNNPRQIKDKKFKQLVKSITEFPQMLRLRPVVVNADMMVLGGNMRLAAAKAAGLLEIPIIKADQLTLEQQNEFIIKDNISHGEWEFEMLANEWNVELLTDWGLDLWQPEEKPDYGVLNQGGDMDDDLDAMADGVKKAIQIEFEPEHYDEAQGLVKFWREQGAYVGAMLIEKLREERAKLGE